MKKVTYVEYLRAVATIAVVIIHVTMCLPNNYSIQELGVFPYAIMNSTYALVNWAVPIFLMISGGLLLNPQKKIDEKKILKYIKRMALVLILFGGVCCIRDCILEKEH